MTDLFRNLKSGGWIEVHEIHPKAMSDDDTIKPDYPYTILCDKVDKTFAEIYGWHFCIAPHIPQMLQDTGFVNVQARSHEIPIGRWHSDPRQREMGLFNQNICDDFIPALLAKHEAMGLTAAEAEKLGQDVWDGFSDPKIHAKLRYYATWAQKPSQCNG